MDTPSWLNITEESVWSRVRIILAAAASVVSGAALGFYWGYKEKPDCEDTAFQKQLASADLWQIVGHQWLRQHTWRITYNKPAVTLDAVHSWLYSSSARDRKNQPIIITRIENGRAFFTVHDLYDDIKASRIETIQLGGIDMAGLLSPTLEHRLQHNQYVRSVSLVPLAFGL
jgi:hypothetical protein